MNISDFDYSAELSIDPDALDIEWLIQPSLFIKYAEALAEARLELDKNKTELDMIRADIDNEIRQNPIPYSGSDKKPTETQIANLVIQHPDVQNANDRFIESKHIVELLSLAVRAFDQKKAALENLVKLHGQQYFAGPMEPRNIGNEYHRSLKSQQTRSRVGKRLNRDKRTKIKDV